MSFGPRQRSLERHQKTRGEHSIYFASSIDQEGVVKQTIPSVKEGVGYNGGEELDLPSCRLRPLEEAGVPRSDFLSICVSSLTSP